MSRSRSYFRPYDSVSHSRVDRGPVVNIWRWHRWPIKPSRVNLARSVLIQGHRNFIRLVTPSRRKRCNKKEKDLRPLSRGADSAPFFSHGLTYPRLGPYRFSTFSATYYPQLCFSSFLPLSFSLYPERVAIFIIPLPQGVAIFLIPLPSESPFS